MQKHSFALALVLATGTSLLGCAAPEDEVGVDPGEASEGKADGLASALPDVQCAGTPVLPAKQPWRHSRSRLISVPASAHRGFDLVASASEAKQVLAGAASYIVGDKALEDEQVDLYACRAGAWQYVTSAMTDKEGLFKAALTGAKRLPVGMRDMYVAITGDNSGAKFLAVVAPDGTAAAVSDIDGTLTSSEEAFQESLVTHDDVAIHPGAPAALTALRGRGYLPVYVTSRGHIFTEQSRNWLAAQGMPRGPIRLAPTVITLPGSATVKYKSDVFAGLESHGLEVAVGIGNRATDIAAYSKAGVDRANIWIKGPEFISETKSKIAAGQAQGFTEYSQLAAMIAALPVR